MATAPTTPPSVAALSTPPNRATDSQTDFSNKADAFLSDLPDFGTQQNALAIWENTTAVQVYDNAVEANASADSANLAKTAALGAANYVGVWSSLSGAYNAGVSVFHNGVIWALLVNTSNIAATTPSSANTDWEQVSYEITQSEADTTAGRLLKTGDGGLLGKAIELPSGNVDNATVGGVIYYGYSGMHPSPSTGGNPFPEQSGAFHLECLSEIFTLGSGEYVTQVATSISSTTPFKRFRTKGSTAGGWSDWQEVWHSGNNPSSLGTTSGYQKLASGMIIQWAKVSTTASQEGVGSTSSTITFPIAFPTKCVSVVATAEKNITNTSYSVVTDNLTTTSVQLYVYQPSSGTSTTEVQMIAMGY